MEFTLSMHHTLEKVGRVKNKRYNLSLFFIKSEINDNEMRSLYEFIGKIIYHERTKTRTYSGVDIPVQLEIFKLNDDNTKVLILKKEILTRGRHEN